MISRNFELIALFMAVAILLIVPITNAEKYPSVSSAIAVSAFPLPELQFNNSQEKTVVNVDLSPGKNIRTTDGSLTNIIVPIGAIIHHANNITTIFDDSGLQVFIADDDEAEIIHTFKGDLPATFIHEVPNNSVIVDRKNILHVVNNNTRILTIIASGSNESYIPTEGQTCIGSPYPQGWIEGTEALINSSSLYQFSADWNFPDSPDQTYSNYPVFIWNGLYSCGVGDQHTGLVQPVLEWNYVSHTWTMSSWYVWTNQTIWPNNDAIYSARVSGSISPGDTVQGNILINANGYDAIASIIDLGPNGAGSSTLFLTDDTAPTDMSSQNLSAQIVLEGVSAIRQNSANFLPKPVIFKNFILTDHDNNDILPTTPMTSFVNHQFWDQYNFTDSDNLTVYNRWPSDLTLVNNPDRVAPTIANFSTLVTSGHGTTVVPFTDLSTGSPFLWLWNFGDGSYSIDQNPAHTYSAPGLYTVNLTAWNAGGVNSLIKTNYINIVFVPVPGFTVNVDQGTAPLSVQFNDTSTNSPTGWNWSFGDNSYSTTRNVSHTYTQPGSYNVSLFVSNDAGGNTSSPHTIIANSIPLLANFTANSTSGRAPHIVQFTDTSTGSPTSWNWSFGDGQTSTTQNPVHTFNQGGAFIIALNVTNVTGFNTSTRTGYIIVNGDKAGIFCNSSGYGFWYMDYNNDGVNDKTFQFGSTADISVVGDWDGNGTTDAGVYRPAQSNGHWYLDTNKASGVEYDIQFGSINDIPVVGDWNNDGTSDIGVYRPAQSNGHWYLDTDKLSDVEYDIQFGTINDIPVVGDWDGSGTIDVGVYRKSTGHWYLDTDKLPDVEYDITFGSVNDTPVVGDWNDDGSTDIGVYRKDDGHWYLDTNKAYGVEYAIQFGSTTDIPVVGDWDGNGMSDVGMFRPGNTYWYLNYYKQNSTVDKSFQFGNSTAVPKVGTWI